MSARLIRRVQQVAHHRNGVAGEPFHAVLFENAEDGALMVGVVFDTAEFAVAVLKVEPLSDPAVGVTFGANSFRGDQYAAELRAAIAAEYGATTGGM